MSNNIFQMNLIKTVLLDMFKLFDFEFNGEKIQVDEVEVHTSPQGTDIINNDKKHFYYDTFNLKEPRLLFIDHFLHRYLPYITFRYKGQIQLVNGYRLKNLQQWAGEKVDNLYENISSLSTYCNCYCEICYEDQNPIPYTRINRMLSLDEVETRIKYYDKKDQTGLPSALFVFGEPLLNPDSLEIFAALKDADETLDGLTTNGSFLTEEVIKKLARLGNVKLVVSINSLNPDYRQKVMRDAKKDGTVTAIKSLTLLQKYSIPYSVSITGWPGLDLNDIEDTLWKLEDLEPHLVRICLPGFNRYNQSQTDDLLYNRWDDLVALVNRVKPQVSYPLSCVPHLYGEEEPLIPQIDGVYKGYAAEKAGLRVGDLVTEMNQKNIITKTQLASLLRTAYRDQLEQINLTVLRGEQKLEMILRQGADDKKCEAKPVWGIFLNQTFKIGYLEQMKKIIEKYQAQDVMVFTSKIASSLIKQIINQIEYYKRFFMGINLNLEVVPHYYWGGNIMVNNLHLISDFQLHLEKVTSQQNIDLILIPSTILDEWNMDFCGSSIHELNGYNIPIEFIECDQIVI